jgi:hypothetical protein
MASEESHKSSAGMESMQLAEGMKRISSSTLRPETGITPVSHSGWKREHVRLSDISCIFK